MTTLAASSTIQQLVPAFCFFSPFRFRVDPFGHLWHALAAFAFRFREDSA
jgi:hypothetical protein